MRPLGQGCRHVDAGQGLGGCLDRGGQGAGLLAPGLEDLGLHGQRPLAGLGDAGVELGQLHGGEPHLARQGLAVDEERVQRRLEQRLGLLGRGLQEVAQHRVVADAEGDSALRLQPGLQLDHHLAAVVPERAGLVQLGADGGGDEAPVAGGRRQVRAEAGVQHLAQTLQLRLVIRIQRRAGRRQLLGQAGQAIAVAAQQRRDGFPGQQAVA